MESITIVGKSVSYANNQTSKEMAKQQSNLTSVLVQIDNLPSVLINEGVIELLEQQLIMSIKDVMGNTIVSQKIAL